MKEEARVFLRTAAYALVVAVIYWFVSYEVAGTVLLVVLGMAAAALTAMLPRSGRTKVLRAPLELATFGEGEEPIMEIEEVPLPALSLQPLLVALGAAGVTLGLVFGAWLWLPGALVLAGAAWRWHTELG
jgi:hypothetical protein